MPRRAHWRRVAAPWLLVGALPVFAQDTPPAVHGDGWLTLPQALAALDEEHPQLRAARAGLEGARAGLARARADNGISARLELTPQRAQTVLPEQWRDDSRAQLLVDVPLYDFGLSEARERAGLADVGSQEVEQRRARARQRYEIMARYFDVILADMRYAADNEEMAHKYVRYDKGKTRQELGELSPVDVLELETIYREALSVRTRSAQRQYAAREALALAMNQPDRVISELERPALPGNARGAPDFDQALAQAMAGNQQLAAIRKLVEADEQRVAAARARARPRLSAEFEAAHYDYELPSRNQLRGTLNINIPLYQGGMVEADVAAAQAVLDAARARLAAGEYALRREVLAAAQDIEALIVERKTASVRADYRDRYVDRARSIYELELQTTLGDAFARLTDAQWAAEKVNFELALAWARLDILLGRMPGSALEEVAK